MKNACAFRRDHPDLIWPLFSFYWVVVLNMAASRLCAKISDDDLIRFSEEHENENTRMKMLKDAAFETDRKIVNHSNRKHLIQKMVDSEIPPNEIIQITGHKNINNYSRLSATRKQQLSAILSNPNLSYNFQESTTTSSLVRTSISTSSNTTLATPSGIFQGCIAF